MYPFITFAKFSFPTYWLCAIIGILFAVALALIRRRAVRFHTSAEDVFLTILCAVTGAVFGAKAFQIIGLIVRDGGAPGFWTLKHWAGMMPGVGVFYGGLAGGFFAALFFIRKYKLDFWDITDILVPSVLLFHAFGRVGCFFAGCCYGGEAAWGVVFPPSAAAPGGVPLIPVQLYEAAFNLLVLAAVLIARPERKRPGSLLPLYIITYAVGRFALEFLRGDAGRGIYLLSVSQWISLLLLPAGLLALRRITEAQSPSRKKFIFL